MRLKPDAPSRLKVLRARPIDGDVGKHSPSKPGTSARFRVYVKAGSQQRFDQLRKESAGLPVAVEWDRRVADRRDPVEAPGAEAVGLTPRTGERRKASSFAFQQADFVVVEEEGDDEA